MAAKRVPLERGVRRRITGELVDIYLRIREIREAGLGERWEHETPPGRRREMHDLTNALHAGLGLSPWHDSPAFVNPERQIWDDDSWPLAIELRDLLEAERAG